MLEMSMFFVGFNRKGIIYSVKLDIQSRKISICPKGIPLWWVFEKFKYKIEKMDICSWKICICPFL